MKTIMGRPESQEVCYALCFYTVVFLLSFAPLFPPCTIAQGKKLYSDGVAGFRMLFRLQWASSKWRIHKRQKAKGFRDAAEEDRAAGVLQSHCFFFLLPGKRQSSKDRMKKTYHYYRNAILG